MHCATHGAAKKSIGGKIVTDSVDPDRQTKPAGLIRNPKDFWGGLGLTLLAAFAWWATRDLPGQQGFAFGPGTAPRLFIVLLGIISLAILAHGLIVIGPALESWSVRGPLFVLSAVLVFAATIRTIGLIPATFLVVMISSAASAETKWLQTLIWAVVLSVFCAVLFPYALNLPMQLWPRF